MTDQALNPRPATKFQHLATGEFNPHLVWVSLVPTIAEMEALAKRVLSTLPAQFRSGLADVVLQVEDFATPDQLQAVGLDDRWRLSGLYEGRPLPEQSVWDISAMPPRIWLFRQPLLAEMQHDNVALEKLIRHVVVHEAGHHFGFSDEEMHALEQDASND